MLKKKNKNKENKDPKLTEEDYLYLDSVILFMRFVSKESDRLNEILKPIAFDLMERFYSDRDLPMGEVRQVGEMDNNPTLSSLLGGRLH